MVAVAEGVIIAASPLGKFKTVFQILALVMFIVKNAPMLSPIHGQFEIASWALMAAALVLTIWSAADYFYHARELITGPWSPHEGRRATDQATDTEDGS
jgi:phosphatidylglycerophosphate synthase